MNGSSVVEQVKNLVATFDSRDRTILFTRILADPKITLESVGVQLNLTRERVRQLEKIVKERVASFLNSNDLVGSYCDSVVDATGMLAPFSRVAEQVPEILEDIFIQIDPEHLVTIPTWRAVQALESCFECDGDWFYVGSREQVVSLFAARFVEVSGEKKFIEVSEVFSAFDDWGTASPEELILWAQSLGYKVVLGALVSSSVRSMNDLAVIALAIKGTPLTTAAIHQTVASSKSVKSLANQMSVDSRLQRVGADVWGLVKWGDEEFLSIREAILTRVDKSGSVALGDLIEELTTKFGVAESSVRAYSAAWPLKSEGGLVSRQEGQVTPKGRPFSRSRGSYVSEAGYAFRTTVTLDHLRGSGSQFPTALALALGGSIGASLVFTTPSKSGQIRLNWNGNQATISTMKSELELIGAVESDEICISFNSSMATFRKLPSASGDPFEDLGRLCLISPEAKVTRVSVAKSIGLDETAVWDEILQSAIARKDKDLVRAVRKVMSQLIKPV